MKESTLKELLETIDEYDRLGFAGHPDASGIRGHGLDRRPDRRSDDYPYDRDVSYGQPANYDRGNSATGPLNHPLTPKDDEFFSLSLLGLKEVSGSPILFSRGDSSQQGSSVPGASGGWANDPPKDWDENELDLDDVGEAQLTIDPAPPDVEAVPVVSVSRDQTDDDLEGRLDRIWGNNDNTNFVDPPHNPDIHVVGPDPWGPAINTRFSSRLNFGLIPKESVWEEFLASLGSNSQEK